MPVPLGKTNQTDRIPQSPPVIAPVPQGVYRPLWSVMIPVYNCAEYLKIALKSVLMQDAGPQLMQIEVVDDCSTDANIEKIVKKIGGGRVKYFRQPKNVGSLRNFETCLNRATGHYIHLLHGDDCVKDGFYLNMKALLDKFPEAGAAFCSFDLITATGQPFGTSQRESDVPCILDNWLYRIAEKPRLQYACMVVKRQVYEKLGGFYLAHYGEDWEMWARIARHYPTAYLPDALAEYRVHQNSITRHSFHTGNNIRDIAKVIDKITHYLPEQDKEALKKKACKFYAGYAIEKSYSLWYRSRNKKVVLNQLRQALQMHRDFSLLFQAITIQFLMLLSPSLLVFIRKCVRRIS